MNVSTPNKPSWMAKHMLKIEQVELNTMQKILEVCLECGFRDIYINSASYIRGKLGVETKILSKDKLTERMVEALAEQISTKGEVGLTRHGEGVGGRKIFTFTKDNENFQRAFRYCITQITTGNKKGLDIAIRPIEYEVPTTKTVMLSDALIEKICSVRKGLILFCGSTGEGKTASIAAIIRYILERESNMRILEFARPPEYDFQTIEAHPSNHIVHHEIAENETTCGDLKSYCRANALAMRKAADWFAVGEMTEPESFRSAMTLSNTGHIVSSTLHANSVAACFPRIYNMFPPEERNDILYNLINESEVIVAQKLVRRLNGTGRNSIVAIREMLILTREVKRRLNQFNDIKQISMECAKILEEQGTSFEQQATLSLQNGLIDKATFNEFMDSL